MLNQNKSRSGADAGGTSFTLNGDTFYSANANSTTGATDRRDSSLLLNDYSRDSNCRLGNTIPAGTGRFRSRLVRLHGRPRIMRI